MYLRLIILKNLLLSYGKDNNIRSLLMCDVHVSTKTIVDVMLQLPKLVESRISGQMRTTRGCTMYDSWSLSGVHFLGTFATNCVGPTVPPRIMVLAMRPLDKEDNVNGTTPNSMRKHTFRFSIQPLTNTTYLQMTGALPP